MLRNIIRHGLNIFGMTVSAFLGVLCLASALESVTPGPFIPEEFTLKLIAGLAFTGMGLGAAYFIYGREPLAAWWQRRQFERHAESPWRRRREWRKGRIHCRTPNYAGCMWVVAAGWNGLMGFLFWINGGEIAEAVKMNGLLALPLGLIVLIGLGVLYGTARTTFDKHMADRAVFVMASVPAWTGGRLEGTILTRIPMAMKKQARLKLSGTSTAPMHAVVPADRLRGGRRGIEIPVEFEIPEGCEPTDEFNPDTKIAWILEAGMELPEKELDVRFEVPVYRKAGRE